MPRPVLSRIPERTPLYKEDFGPGGRFLKTLSTDWRNFLQKLDAPVYKEAVWQVGDTTIADNVGYPVPVLESGPAVDMKVVLKLDNTADLNLVFKRNTVQIGSMRVPTHSGALIVVSKENFDVKGLQFAEGDVLTMQITASDGTVSAGGVFVATLRWIAE